MIKRYGFECEYDEILKKQIIRFNGCSDDHPDLSDESAFQQIRSCCLKNDLPSTCTDNLVNVFAANAINPVMEWIESKPWDGVDRIPELISTLLLEDENHREYALQIITVWLTQCIAALDGAKRTPRKDFIAKFELCLVFAGKQGGRKTSWFKALLPNYLDEYYVEGVSLILDEKDSIKQAVSGWIVELGEIDSTFRKSDIAQLKAFLSKRIDAIRLPYARVASNFARRTSFCGSVNEMEFLNDATGNRRFLPLVILSCNKDHDIDLQQLWAQMLQGYLNGNQWWLTPEQDLLVSQVQERHRPVSAVAESLSFKFDFINKSGREQFFSATSALIACKFPKPTAGELKEARAFIEAQGIERKKVNGTWGYYLHPFPSYLLSF